MSDIELLRRWRQGDAGAGADLVQRHYLGVHRFFCSKVDPYSAEDLAQATFETLCTLVSKREPHRGVRPHLFSIARYKLLEYYRKSSRMREHFDPLEDSVGDTDLDRSMVSLIAAKRRLSSFYGAFRRLPLDSQILIELKHYEGFTETELGAMYDVDANVMKSRVRRARERLRKELAAASGGALDGESGPVDTDFSAHLESLRQMQPARAHP